jgi:hypothetical protein
VNLPGSVWCQEFLRHDLLPDRRVVVRFDFSFGGRKSRGWLLIERREGELCRVDPGFGDDLVVTINHPLMFTHWHQDELEPATTGDKPPSSHDRHETSLEYARFCLLSLAALVIRYCRSGSLVVLAAAAR